MRKSSVWFIPFFIDVAIDIYFVFNENTQGRLFSKTLLMPLLFMAFYYSLPRWSKPAFVFSAAIFFSWIGDIMLMFDSQYPALFIAGLLFFLLAHICYIIFFLQIYQQEKLHKGRWKYSSMIVTAAYVLFILYLLWPGLGDLKIPVMIYALAIGLMLVTTLMLTGKLPKEILYCFISGALLFVISDSMLAYNKFRQAFSLASPLIMITYCIAQLLLTIGTIRYTRFALQPLR